jgi:PAS domain S-box-containing protein
MARGGFFDDGAAPVKSRRMPASLSPLHRAKAKQGAKSRDKALARLGRRAMSGPKPTHWQRFVELNFAPIMVTDRAGRIVAVNAAFSALTGYARGEVVGSRASLLKSGTMPGHLFQDLWQSILRGHAWQGEIQNRRKDGSLFWCQVNICPVADAKAASTLFLSVLQDLTPLKDSWRPEAGR